MSSTSMAIGRSCLMRCRSTSSFCTGYDYDIGVWARMNALCKGRGPFVFHVPGEPGSTSVTSRWKAQGQQQEAGSHHSHPFITARRTQAVQSNILLLARSYKLIHFGFESIQSSPEGYPSCPTRLQKNRASSWRCSYWRPQETNSGLEMSHSQGSV